MRRSSLALLFAFGLMTGPQAAFAGPQAPSPAAAESARQEGLYIKTYGDRTRPAIVFLHGGPGGNAASFELSAAQDLAKDHFVVVYDQAGCGRSAEPAKEGDYDFAHAVQDLKTVIQRTGAVRPLLVGHSFGGTIGLKFLEADPQAARGLVLASTPIDYAAGLRTIRDRCRDGFGRFHNTEGLAEIDRLAKLPPDSAEYAGGLFRMAAFCNLYATWDPTEEQKALVARLSKAGPLVMDLRVPPFTGFLKREHYTTADYGPLVTRYRDRIGAIYGVEDWTLDASGNAFLRRTLGDARFQVLPRASHGVFVDQETLFVQTLRHIEASLKP